MVWFAVTSVRIGCDPIETSVGDWVVNLMYPDNGWVFSEAYVEKVPLAYGVLILRPTV